MALAALDGGVVWSSDPLTTIEKADAYALARGWSDWAALSDERKLAAVLDASTFIRVSFDPPQTITSDRASTIEDATAEAARLSLSGPLLGGQAATTPARRRVKAGSVEVEYAERSASDVATARLALVRALLRSAGATSLNGVNVRLSRS